MIKSQGPALSAQAPEYTLWGSQLATKSSAVSASHCRQVTTSAIYNIQKQDIAAPVPPTAATAPTDLGLLLDLVVRRELHLRPVIYENIPVIR